MTSAQAPREIVFWIIADSDWHCGAGYGSAARGDKAQRLDAEGLPMCGGRQFKYSLRDAGEQVAVGLDADSGADEWSQLWARLMGTKEAAPEETRALVEISNAVMPECIAAEFRDRPLVREEAVLPRVRNRHSRKTRQTQKNMLLRQEMARAGAVLGARVRYDDMDAASASLIVAASVLMDRLGGVKNRGSGRIHVVLSDVQGNLLEPGDFVRQLGTAQPHGGARQRAIPADPTQARPQVTASLDVTLAVAVTTRSSVIVQEGVQGNAIHSLDYLPGRLFLPAISRALGVERTDSLIREGRLVVRNAYPEIRVEDVCIRGVPIPRALRERARTDEWDDRRVLVNALVAPPEQGEAERKANATERFYLARGESDKVVSVTHVRRERRTHSATDARFQATSQDVGGVFVAYSIAAGQRFLFNVFVNGVSDAEKHSIRVALEGFSRIGRTRSVEYGEVQTEVVGKSAWVSGTEDRLIPDAGETDERELALLLVSDTIVIGPDLMSECTSDGLRRCLSEALGACGIACGVTVEELAVPRLEPRPAEVLSVRRGEGFHTRWGMPRDTVVALQAGSCARLRVRTVRRIDGPTWTTALAKIEREGLGERVAEGYGEVLFRPPFLTAPPMDFVHQFSEHRVPRLPGTVLPEVIRDATARYVRNLQRLAAERRVRQLASAWAADGENRESLGVRDGGPSLSQLGTLRSLVTATDLAQVATELSRLSARKASAERGEERAKGLRAALGIGLQELQRLAATPRSALQKIGFDEQVQSECKEGELASADLDSLAFLALRDIVVQSIKAHTREVQAPRRRTRGVAR